MRMMKVVNVLLVSFQFAFLPSLGLAKDKDKKKKEKKYKEKIHIVMQEEKVETKTSDCACSKLFHVESKQNSEKTSLLFKEMPEAPKKVELYRSKMERVEETLSNKILVEVETVLEDHEGVCEEKPAIEERVEEVIQLVVEKVEETHEETKNEVDTKIEDKTFCLDPTEHDFAEFQVSSLCFTVGRTNNITHVSATVHL